MDERQGSRGVGDIQGFHSVSSPPVVLPPIAAPTLAARLAPRVAGGAWRPRLTIEHAIYAVIVVLAILTRFWDLGTRTLHHDESLHTYYSWLYTTGQGYVHDPLMHGPLLFHLVGLAFLVLGDSDVTGRVMPAIFGVAMVWLPYLLRGPRFLGRWGALAASVLILISPALLYQSRYLRHDIFTLTGTLLLFIAIVRYVDLPQRRWLIVIGVTLPMLTANHEIIFGLLFVFLGVLALALLWGRLRLIAPIVIATGILFVGCWLVLPRLLNSRFPEIPWQNPTRDAQIEFYRELLTNPALIASGLVLAVGVTASILLLRSRRPVDAAEPGLIPAYFGDAPPRTVEHAVVALWRDRAGLSWMIGLFVVISIVLFTSLFTNLYGLATATFATDGTLLYWLGQHDYQRGEQPWFYYLLLIPQYEFAGVLLGLGAALAIAINIILVGLRRRAPGPRFFFHLMLLAWFGGILAGLSWAGEKMPWLMTHITLPLVLLAAVLIGTLSERWQAVATRRAARPWAQADTTLVTALLVIGVGWLLLAARLTYGEFAPAAATGATQRIVTDWAAARWWWLALPPLAFLALLGLGLATRGLRRTGQITLLGGTVLLALLQVHAGWRMVYQEGDVPRDMMIYTQTAPDVSRMVRELTALSNAVTGGQDLAIWYDDNSGTSWPLQWYLRDFPNRRMFGNRLSASPAGEAPVVIVGSGNNSQVAPYMSGYTAQEYVLRWWFPEDVYRDFAIAPDIRPGRSAWKDEDQPHGPRAILASIGESLSTLGTMEGQQRLFRLVMYRDLPQPIGRVTYYVYVRNDLLPLLNDIRY